MTAPAPTPLSRARALARSTHPGPTLAVTALTVLLGIGVGVTGIDLVLLGTAMLLGQASVGLSNDWQDAGRDAAAGRTDKPVALGDVTPEAARNAALATAAAAVVCSIPFGPAFIFVHGVFLASAWGYNLGLKGTRFSVVPYLVSFGLLPVLVALARSEHDMAAPWAIVAGGLMGAAAHFANVIPDLEDDSRTGIRGLPHRLGMRGSGLTAFGVLLAAGLIVALAPAGPPDAWQWLGLAATLLIVVLGLALVAVRRATRLMFLLIIVAALVTVVMLVISGERMLL